MHGPSAPLGPACSPRAPLAPVWAVRVAWASLLAAHIACARVGHPRRLPRWADHVSPPCLGRVCADSWLGRCVVWAMLTPWAALLLGQCGHRPLWQNLLNYRAHMHLSLSNDL